MPEAARRAAGADAVASLDELPQALAAQLDRLPVLSPFAASA
jgi:hypothetical protein